MVRGGKEAAWRICQVRLGISHLRFKETRTKPEHNKPITTNSQP